jgi:hypothetical protein
MAKKTRLNKLATVNVIELEQGTLQSIRSFNDDVKGNKQAEKTYIAMIKSNLANSQGSGEGDRFTKEDIECFLDDGIYNDEAGYELMLSHSDTASESV